MRTREMARAHHIVRGLFVVARVVSRESPDVEAFTGDRHLPNWCVGARVVVLRPHGLVQRVHHYNSTRSLLNLGFTVVGMADSRVMQTHGTTPPAVRALDVIGKNAKEIWWGNGHAFPSDLRDSSGSIPRNPIETHRFLAPPICAAQFASVKKLQVAKIVERE